MPALVSEKRFLRGDGGVVWGRRWATLLRDHAGKPTKIIGICEDISAQKTAEIALQESETRLQLARDAAGFGVWDWDLTSGKVICSEQMRHLRGLEPTADAACDTLFSGIHPDDQASFRTSIEAAIASDERPHNATFRAIHPDGQIRWLHGRAKIVRDANGKALRVVGLSTDVTEAHETEAKLRRLTLDLEARVGQEVAARETAQRRAARAERMQALGQLAGGIAHDFNNVLQMVLGASTLIEEDPNDAQQVASLAQLITDAADRGGAITGRLLTVGRHGHLRAEALNVDAVLNSMREIFVHTLGGAITVDVRTEEDLPDILADRAQLETSLINLAANARDAMPQGGRLRITAARDSAQSNHPAGLEPGNYVRITVGDTGTGMDAATLAHVGEPFFTTKKPGAGTGLGLAMVKGFAEQSGGAVDITSQSGHGTSVTLWLPADAGEPPRTPDNGSIPPVAAIRPTRPTPRSRAVLVVDDEPLVRQVIVQYLSRLGYHALTAASGTEALAIIDSAAHLDALVTDLSMPGMDGLTLISAARERHPGLPSVLLTGYAGDGVSLAINGAINGSYSLLRKPVTGPQLAERIRVLLAPTEASG